MKTIFLLKATAVQKQSRDKAKQQRKEAGLAK